MSTNISEGQETSDTYQNCLSHQLFKYANRIIEYLKIFFRALSFNMHVFFYKYILICISPISFKTNRFVKPEVCTSVSEKQYGNNRHLKFVVLRSNTSSKCNCNLGAQVVTLILVISVCI